MTQKFIGNATSHHMLTFRKQTALNAAFPTFLRRDHASHLYLVIATAKELRRSSALPGTGALRRHAARNDVCLVIARPKAEAIHISGLLRSVNWPRNDARFCPRRRSRVSLHALLTPPLIVLMPHSPDLWPIAAAQPLGAHRSGTHLRPESTQAKAPQTPCPPGYKSH